MRVRSLGQMSHKANRALRGCGLWPESLLDSVPAVQTTHAAQELHLLFLQDLAPGRLGPRHNIFRHNALQGSLRPPLFGGQPRINSFRTFRHNARLGSLRPPSFGGQPIINKLVYFVTMPSRDLCAHLCSVATRLSIIIRTFRHNARLGSLRPPSFGGPPIISNFV